MFLPDPLASSNAKEVLDIVFKLSGYLSDLWNLFMVFSAVVVGWRFSTKEWGAGQRAATAVLYVCFIVVNSMALHSTYGWLDDAMSDLRLAAVKLDEATPRIRDAMKKVEIPHQRVQIVTYYFGAATVLAIIIMSDEWARKIKAGVADASGRAWARVTGRVKDESDVERGGAGGERRDGGG